MEGLASGVWWFVPGLVLGWLLGWWWARPRAQRPTALRANVEPSATPIVADDAQPVPDESEVRPQSRIIDVGAARSVGFNLKHADDLTIIEGIGPKIDELFHASGIISFSQLASLGVAEMIDILDRGGPSFRSVNPGSWARQAELASENRWMELKRLQEELIGVGPPAP